ncbi:N-acetylmuramoyl-L-alanine amidase [Streptomyces catenulae]|uniref:N-acetylmuramoyl-L-alanine amidase n=1 Tax=Streptomyces catenulae TaxID=66875 RepID=A0ABV2YSX6_9ACTN|nr:N-acetylmuramoyl-L-alanine amidase [Streptomyces catenulae]
MESDRTSLPRRRLLTGAAALAAAAALVPAGSAAARPRTARPRAAAYPPVHWAAADPANFTEANRPTEYPVEMVVIHVTQETFADTLKLFKDPNHKAAAHYVVRSSDGYLAQCVSEKNVAWHAGNWDYNTRSIGIEHEGWIDDPKWFTDALYQKSAALTAAICDRYHIPKDREHIIGHVEVPGTDHTDPGQYWDWSRYMDLVKGRA